MIQLSLGQNDSPMEQSFWPKDSSITHISFELCLFRNLALCTFFCSPSSYWNEINKFYYYSQNLENPKERLVLNQISKMIWNQSVVNIIQQILFGVPNLNINCGKNVHWWTKVGDRLRSLSNSLFYLKRIQGIQRYIKSWCM